MSRDLPRLRAQTGDVPSVKLVGDGVSSQRRASDILIHLWSAGSLYERRKGESRRMKKSLRLQLHVSQSYTFISCSLLTKLLGKAVFTNSTINEPNCLISADMKSQSSSASSASTYISYLVGMFSNSHHGLSNCFDRHILPAIDPSNFIACIAVSFVVFFFVCLFAGRFLFSAARYVSRSSDNIAVREAR